MCVGYPLIIYLGITQWSARATGFLLFSVGALLIAGRLRKSPRHLLVSAIAPFLPAALLGLASGVIGDQRFLLALPTLVSASLLVTFARSLRPGSIPMIQRFAEIERAQAGREAPFNEEALLHCRRFTRIWGLFFFLNAAVSGVLAYAALVDWWAYYTCVLGYIPIGIIFIAEKLVRPTQSPAASKAIH